MLWSPPTHNHFGSKSAQSVLGDFLKRLRGQSDRRRERREAVTLGTVRISGRSFPIRNWSSTGFLVASCDADYREGDGVDIDFQAELPGKSIRFACRAIVVRFDRATGELAGVFTMMDRDTRIMVAHHFE